MLDLIGWIATAIFAGSYFCKRPVTMRSIQALAALLWIGYGMMINAPPVIVANLVVAVVAASSAWRLSNHGINASDETGPQRKQEG